MTINLSDTQEQLIRSLVQAGRYASQADAIEAALRLLEERDESPKPAQPGHAAGPRPSVSVDRDAVQALQRMLQAAGLLSEIKPPITDLAPYRDRRPIAIQDEPLSETVIRERR